MVAQNQNNAYFSAVVYGYGITINGSQVTGSGASLSGSMNGAVTLISHSVWVGYTGNGPSIGFSGYANFNGIWSLSNQTISGSGTLDKVGSAPSMGSMTAPTTATIDEATSSITVKWNSASSYNNSGTYRVDVSINGGSWTFISGDLGWGTTSYTYTVSNNTQGITYQFRVCCGNDVGWSSHSYSGTVTLNKLNPPTIGSVPNPFNPYSSTSFTVGLTGGSQTNGSTTFMRKADVYMTNNQSGEEVRWYCSNPSSGNTSITITVPTADVLTALGSAKYAATMTVVAWIENPNGSRSGYTTTTTTLNINSDGAATPTLAPPTLSGGTMGYTSTCFIAGISSITVTSGSAATRRAPSGTTLSYTITCTGASNVSSSSATFSGLSEGVKTITVTVKDSRGLSTSVSTQARIQSYSAPTIQTFTASRLDSPQTSASLIYTMYYTPIYAYSSGVNTQGTQLNRISVQQYSKNNSTWTTCTTGTTLTGLATDTVYNIYLRIADKVKTTTYTTGLYVIPTITTNLSIRKWGVGIGGISQDGYRFTVEGTSSGVKMAAGGLFVVGSGSSATTMISNGSLASSTKKTYLTSDNEIRLDTNLINGYSNRKEFVFGTDGTLTVPSTLTAVTIKTINGVNMADLDARLAALEIWKSQVLAGTTTVLVETEATSTASDEAVSDNAINTDGLSEPTLGDVEVEETTEETEVESSSESLSKSLSESESTSTSESSSESESESMSESLSDSDSESESQSESESTSESNTESEAKSESIQIEPIQKEELS